MRFSPKAAVLQTPLLLPSGCGGIASFMLDFIAFEFVPLAATLFVWVGGAGLIFIFSIAVALFVFGKPVQGAETGEVAPPVRTAKTMMTLGGANLLLVAAGLTMRSIIEGAEQDPELILWIVSLFCLSGALLAICVLWYQLRRRT